MLFIMRGTSCSGKDTFIERHFTNKNAILSSDDFRELLIGDREVQNMNKIVFDTMHQILDLRLSNRPEYTVFNATNLRMRSISPLIELCKKHHTRFCIISIEPPELSELLRRNQKRSQETNFLVPEAVLERHHQQYYASIESFKEEAMKNPLGSMIVIDQNHEVADEYE